MSVFDGDIDKLSTEDIINIMDEKDYIEYLIEQELEVLLQKLKII